MNDYFVAASSQLIARAKLLMGNVPSNVGREFHALMQTCRDKISKVIFDLNEVCDAPQFQLPQTQPERLRQFKRAADELDYLEKFGFSVLGRVNEADERLNRLIDRIRLEINYPLLPPTVCSLSQEYFHILTDLNLLLVPPSEGDFLLHLPDLYHELAHPVLVSSNSIDPRLASFRNAHAAALDEILDHLEREQRTEAGRQNQASQGAASRLSAWQDAYIRYWTTEFFCDLFAVGTLGPAYAWSHLHLCAKRGKNPYDLKGGTHPANDARMTAMLCGLKLLEFDVEAGRIEGKWRELMTITGYKPEQDYVRPYGRSLLNALAEKALEGVEGINCCLATPSELTGVRSTLNEAWNEFWERPRNFAAWERSAVQSLMRN